MKTKFKGILLIVDDIGRSKKFYKDIFGLEVISDFGANATVTGGISFQTKGSWLQITGMKNPEMKYGGNDAELYFETADMAAAEKVLKKHKIRYLHEMREMPWGQLTVRIYDPDMHLIEIGEDMVSAAKRLLSGGMSAEDVSKKTMFPIDVIRSL